MFLRREWLKGSGVVTYASNRKCVAALDVAAKGFLQAPTAPGIHQIPLKATHSNTSHTEGTRTYN